MLVKHIAVLGLVGSRSACLDRVQHCRFRQHVLAYQVIGPLGGIYESEDDLELANVLCSLLFHMSSVDPNVASELSDASVRTFTGPQVATDRSLAKGGKRDGGFAPRHRRSFRDQDDYPENPRGEPTWDGGYLSREYPQSPPPWDIY